MVSIILICIYIIWYYRFHTVEEMCNKVGTVPTMPRKCVRQTHRSNVPAETPSVYYRRSISIPLLDHLLSEMDVRFTTHHQTALYGMCLVPSVLITIGFEEAKAKVTDLAEMYKEDLPPQGIIQLQGEFHCWYVKWRKQHESYGQACLPTTLRLALPHATAMFPSINVLLRILCTLPVTSCSSERSFSGLKRIKTTLRSNMGNQRLTGLSLLHLHQDIPVDTSVVVDDFSRQYPRRMKLTNILAD